MYEASYYGAYMPYRILRQQVIASGAYGEIYVAHDPNLKRDVALKILRHGAASGRSLEQLLTEARLGAIDVFEVSGMVDEGVR